METNTRYKNKKAFSVASIVSAFGAKTIGTKVVDEKRFKAFLADALGTGIRDDFRQMRLLLPHAAHETVSCGVARISDIHGDDDLVARIHRGWPGVYARREKAAPISSLSAVVYTREAYLTDPDVLADSAETARIIDEDARYVLVAVLADAAPAPAPAPSPTAFVHNIAGGNARFIPATKIEENGTIHGSEIWSISGDLDLLHKIISEARWVENYWKNYIIVAD